MTLPSPIFNKNPVEKAPVQNKPQVCNTQNDPGPSAQQSNKRNFSSYCKYCQIGFANDTELFQHRRSHIKCPYDDCKFNANEITISNHIQRSHLKQNALVKITDLTTPEQIEKWREERRKRYPTTQNVILRQQLQEEKHKRGEKLHDSKRRFGDNQQRDFVRNMGNKRNDHRGNRTVNKNNQNRNKKFQKHQNKSPEKPQVDQIKDNSNVNSTKDEKGLVLKNPAVPIECKKSKLTEVHESSDEEETRKVPRFCGTSTMRNYHTVETIVKEKSALSVLGMYGSDSDSCEEDENEAPNDDIAVENVQNRQEEEITKNESGNDEIECQDVNENEPQSDNDDGPEEVPIIKQVEDNEKPADPQKSRKRKRHEEKHQVPKKAIRKSGLDFSKLKNRSINPFLEKLLERDIVHERNVLLQCVNYVVKNKFFEIGQSNDHQENEKS